MKNLHISTRVTIILLVFGLILAFVGFFQAANINVAAVVIMIVMLVSGLFFAAAAVISLRRKSVTQRIVGLAAVVAALYMIGFGIFSYTVLRVEFEEEIQALPVVPTPDPDLLQQ